jgi:hypothetical protein
MNLASVISVYVPVESMKLVSLRLTFVLTLILGAGCTTQQVSMEHTQAFQNAHTIRFVERYAGQNIIPGILVGRGPTLPKGADRNRVVGFAMPFLEQLGYEVVTNGQRADVTVGVYYGSVRVWIRTSTPNVAVWAMTRFWGDVVISCPGTKDVEKLWQGSARTKLGEDLQVDDLGNAFSSPPAAFALVDGDAFRDSGFEPGFIDLFRQLCGQARVARALQTAGASRPPEEVEVSGLPPERLPVK